MLYQLYGLGDVHVDEFKEEICKVSVQNLCLSTEKLNFFISKQNLKNSLEQ